MIPELNIKRDIPIVLNSVSYEDTYSNNFESRRAVIYTLDVSRKLTYLIQRQLKKSLKKLNQIYIQILKVTAAK